MKARVVPERIKHRIKLKERRSEWRASGHQTLIRKGQKFLQRGDRAIGFVGLGCHPGESLHDTGAIYRVFLDRYRSHGPLRQRKSRWLCHPN